MYVSSNLPPPPPSSLLPPPYLYDQAEKDRAKALEHELEGARAIIEVAIDHFMVWNRKVLSLCRRLSTCNVCVGWV